MKTTHLIKLFTTSLLLLVWSTRAHAGGYTNNFTSPADFVAGGVTGTMWDGVYLRSGDVVAPQTVTGAFIGQADTLTFPGFLTVAQTNGQWAGNANDGFLLYKVVVGDFDASVEVAPIYPNVGFNFAGLLARAVSDQSGQGFNPTGTNSTENWMYVSRFNEFSIGDQVRNATNGNDIQITIGGGVTTNGSPVGLTSTNQNTDTNTPRFVRITRVGNLFSFYDKTNSGDAWTLEDTISRGDLAGAAMEVGIQDATFSGAAPQVFFTDFELTGPNVNVATPAGDPSGLSISVANTNSLTLSWTPGAGSDGSLVILKPIGPITSQPAYGITYAGSNAFTTPFTGSLSNLLNGGSNNVVYVGSGSSVTVSGLGSTNITYNAAVYSYKGSGSTISYDTNPALASHIGPGTLVGVSFTVSPTNIPAGGVAVAKVTATFTSGDVQDVSSDPTTIWTSSNSNIIAAANGTLAGITNGSALVSATYSGITGQQTVSVHAPSFLDTFNAPHNYAANNIIGSAWDGLYLGFGDIPGGNAGGNGPGLTLVADSGITTNNMLTLVSAQTGFEGTEDDGLFLYKNVSGGNFQATMHINNYQNAAFQFVGLQARQPGVNGGPFTGGEQFFSWKRFDEFGISTSARRTRNGANSTVDDIHDSETNNFWLLMVRSNFSNFYFYKKANLTDPWTAVPEANFTGLTSANAYTNMQVGIVQNTFVAYIVTNNAGQTNQTIVTNSRSAQIDYFMVDAPTLGTSTGPASGPSGLTMTLNLNNTFTTSWTPAPGSDGTLVVFRPVSQINNNPVSGVTYTGNSVIGSGSGLGSSEFVVSAGSNSTVTVSGVAGGTTYFAAAYSYSSTTNGPAYNTASPALANGTSSNPQGVLVGLPGNRIPKGGVGVASLIGQFPGGTLNDITSIATWSSGNTNILVISSNNVTGIANGTAQIRGSALGFTNSLTVTVYSPTFTDNFSVAHDYKAAGVSGTPWDGVFTTPGGITGTTFVSDPAATMFLADANITTPGSLTVSNQNVGWEFDQNDGFFLFKVIPNDFQVAVHVGNFTNTTYNYPGLLARGFSAGGAPLDGTNGECWVSWARFDEFGIGTRAERDIDNGIASQPNGDVGDTNMWLLMTRTGGTNFNFYQKVNQNDPWKLTPSGQSFSLTNYSGLPMEVGIMHGGFDSGIPAGVTFDSFMLDATLPTIQFTTSGGNLILTWPSIFTDLKTSPTLGPSAVWTAVPITWTVTNGFNVLTVPDSGVAAYYSLRP